MIGRVFAVLASMLSAVGGAWAGAEYAYDGVTGILDQRYMDKVAFQEAVREIVTETRRDRILADIRRAETRLAVATIQQGYAEGEWVDRRRQEVEVIKLEIQSLNDELTQLKEKTP